ncbi:MULTISPECIES: hypothetical protein [unclassified Streptosporangium]|uniref:hypothetical protein n=1 Tax=unclassified Streptosporangium TaxID=2632669 RepID=UPI002E2B42EA|nr:MULTISPECIES: hypothetical protein [unclassified Streptosporangium]
MRREIPECDGTKNPDDSLEARRTGSSASAPEEVSAATFRDLQLGCPAARVAWSLEPDGRTE